MECVKKLNDLVAGQIYVVVGCSDPLDSNYSVNYILLVSEQNSTEYFEIWTTNSLAEYISDQESKEKFMFIVNERNGIKYPLVLNYKKDRNFTLLN